MFGDPCTELLRDASVDDVADIAPRHLARLTIIGKALSHLREALGEIEDVVQAQRLILRDVDDEDVLGFNSLCNMR